MRLISNIFLILVSLSVLSCFKEDDAVVPILPYHGTIMSSGEQADPTYRHQLWFDLSSGTAKQTERNVWDLGFYSGNEFRVILNTSLLMAAAPIEGVTELEQVNSEMVEELKNFVRVADFNTDNSIYVDKLNGDYLNDGTVIAEISANPDENKVYLLNLGRRNYSGNILPDTAYPAGGNRGWKKIKILREGADAYRIQYADLDATEHNEFVIHKNPAYNFVFFSVQNEVIADAEPLKQNWDFCYTVFTNVVEGAGTYIFSDYIMTNNLAGVGAYKVMVLGGEDPELVYNDFKKSDIDASKFVYNDHTIIGDDWRDVFSNVYGDRFFILKNPEGKYFKLRFIRFKDDAGYRGFMQFEFTALD